MAQDSPVHRLIVVSEARSVGSFSGRLESSGEVIVERTSRPLVEGARRLLELGFDPAALLTMRHAGKGYDSFEPLPIGKWAGWTYEERDGGGLTQAVWRPRGAPPEGQKSGSGPVAGVQSLGRGAGAILEG